MHIDGLIFKFLDSTESAAFSAFKLAGLGNNHAADYAAVEAMRGVLNNICADIKVVIGEGERDNAPMLYIGEKLGSGDYRLDLAVDPLEGTNICSSYKEGALSVLAYGKSGSILNAPDLYMEKLITNVSAPINIHDDLEENLEKIAAAKNCNICELKAIVLMRDRHKSLIANLRKIGIRIKLIDDGDIAAVLNMIINNSADVYLGSGGAPEGVLAAVAIKFLGGSMQAKLLCHTDEERQRAEKYAIDDFTEVYTQDDLISGDTIFIATGVTTGQLLKGVKILKSRMVGFESLIITKSGYSRIYRERYLPLY